MTIELDYLKWLTSSISKFGKILNVPLDPIPEPIVSDPSVWPVVTITTESGITIDGAIKPTRQPKRFLVQPGTNVFWAGGTAAKMPLTKGVPADWQIPGATVVTGLGNSKLMNGGDRIVVAKTKPIGQNDPTCLEEAIILEAFLYDLEEYPLRNWPKVIKGVTQDMVEAFLDSTPAWIEVVEGWQGRYAHPVLNLPSAGQPGYGGAIAEITSLGALLLCADIADDQKLRIQDRFMYLAEYLRISNINYPADGGHGNGRYIIALIANLINPGNTDLLGFQYSELIQVYRRPDGTLDWRHNPTTITTKGDGSNAEDYRTCCTANRWAGAAVAASLIVGAANTVNQDWITYTKAYLTEHFNNPEAWRFCNNWYTASLLRMNRGVIGI